ncbi:MAG: hypothetical protein AGIKBDMD_00533 [Synergistaceae bacterium]
MNIITPELLTECLKRSLVPVADAVGNVGQSTVMIGGEWIKLWQMTNAVSVGQKAVKILKKRGITNKEQLRDITTKFGLLYVEGASVEDEPELQELWAKLLVNALDPHFEGDIRVSFMSIIKDLTSLDIKILDIMNSEFLKYRKGTKIFDIYFSAKALSRMLSVSDFIIRASIDNLKRCQLVENTQTRTTNILQVARPIGRVITRNSNNDKMLVPPNPDHFVISALGCLFIDACIA